MPAGKLTAPEAIGRVFVRSTCRSIFRSSKSLIVQPACPTATVRRPACKAPADATAEAMAEAMAEGKPLARSE